MKLEIRKDELIVVLFHVSSFKSPPLFLLRLVTKNLLDYFGIRLIPAAEKLDRKGLFYFGEFFVCVVKRFVRYRAKMIFDKSSLRFVAPQKT